MMRWVLGALVGASLVACASAKNRAAAAAGAEASEYYPLAVGNQWTYEAKVLSQRMTQTVTILKEEDGFFIDSQKGRLKVDAFGLRDDKRYLLREPIEAGRTWTNVVSVSSVEHFKIVSAGELCTVPAGTFERCVMVEIRNRSDEKVTMVNRMTFAPKVGIARIQVAVETAGKIIPQTELWLVSYRVAEAAADAASRRAP
jgi:hypothetical protein